ncbi:hypothetical protein [Ichthyobacterium seriolicida]|uniref:Uncharacterized protein n=1 Tax=Ichthyobacterium seriolicida TaxID=242600 RepID=A0A1J1E5E8_9FLAO|nr:hypothetical protein [Ichthyobacterium seriolicida]BAV94534.1 hypothetical protein JBKA6_0521 [Ichthyobacterium seriolicida]
MFKNLLSLLTLGLVVFSCSKSDEASEKALELKISSVKFEKSKNLNGDDVSEFYEKLFVTTTPARAKGKNVAPGAPTNGYPTEFTIAAANIVGDSVINVELPFNANFEALKTNATAKATITFKSAVEGVTLGRTTITGTSAEIPFEIPTAELTKEKLEAGFFKKELVFSKAGDTSSVKKYTVVVKFSNDKSDECEIKQRGFGFIVADTGANAKASFNQTATAPAAGTKVFAHYAAGNSSKNGDSAANAIEFELRKGKASTAYPAGGELDTAGVDSTKYFKADALILPDGAYIEVDDTPGSTANTAADVNPITGKKKSNAATAANTTDLKGGASNSTPQSYTFRVVAQDGTTKKHYKLTINATAPS